MQYLLDVVEEPWLQRNGRDIIVLSIAALVAIGAIVGIFIWIKKRKKAK
jgi:ABC-type multidrug transport system permease subunit